MRSDGDGRRRWRLAGLGIVAVPATVALVWFLADHDLSQADQWASVFALMLGWTVATVSLARWLIHLAGRRAEPDPASLGRLRASVQELWTREIVARRLHLPRPLRLRWRTPTVPGVRARAALPLRPDEEDAGSPVAALVQAMRGRVPQLIVLGEPGAGKTTLAILYVVADVAAATGDEPVPVPIPVAGWDPASDEDLEDWLTRRICQDHPLAVRDVRWLIRRRRVIPVLDGLDEMPEASRNAALPRLELASAAGLRMVLTCRSREYAATTSAAGVLPQAVVVEVEPVRADDVVGYLTEREAVGSTRWDAVTRAMTDAPQGPLATALSTPLMIALARQAYESPASRPAELTALPSADEVRRRLLDRFLPSLYGSDEAAAKAGRHIALLLRHLPSSQRDPNLLWWRLARAVPAAGIVALVTIPITLLGAVPGFIAMVVGMQNGWPETIMYAALGTVPALLLGVVVGRQVARAAYSSDAVPGRFTWLRAAGTVFADLAVALAAVSVVTACVLFVAGFVARPDVGFVAAGMVVADLVRPPWSVLDPQRDGALVGPMLLGILVVLGVLVLIGGLGAGRAGTPRRSTPRLRDLPARLLVGLAAGLAAGAPWTLLAAMRLPGLSVRAGLLLSAATAVFAGVPLGLGRWLSSPVTDERYGASPASVLRADRRAMLITSGITGLAVAAVTLAVVWVMMGVHDIAIVGLPLLAAGSVMALTLLGSGTAWLSYTIVRLWLAGCGRLPWRLMRFLNDAHRKGLLRQAGAAYQVRHDLIRAHLVAPAMPRRRRRVWRPGSRAARPEVRLLSRTMRVVAIALAVAALPAFAVATDPRPAHRLTIDGGRAQTFGSFSVDGQVLVTVGSDDRVRLWDTGTGDLIGALGTGPEAIVEVGPGPGSGVLATMRRADGLIRLWDVGTGGQVAALDRVRTESDVARADDGHSWVTVGRDDRIARLWDARTGRMIGALQHADNAQEVAFDPTGRTVAMNDEQAGSVRLWDARTGRATTVLSPVPPDADVGYNADGTVLTYDRLGAGLIIRWDPTTGRGIPLGRNTDRDHPADWSSDDTLLATTEDDGVSRLRDARTGRVITELNGTAPTFRPGGRTVLTTDPRNGVVWLTDATDRRATAIHYDGDEALFDPTGHLVATTDRGSTRLWDAGTGLPVATIAGASGVRFSPDGQAFTFYDVDDGIGLAAARSGWSRSTLAEPYQPYTRGEFAPDGRTLWIIHMDLVVRLYAVDTGRLSATLDTGDAYMFSPDGRFLVTDSWDGILRLWEVPAG